jgi:hypothetical protein
MPVFLKIYSFRQYSASMSLPRTFVGFSSTNLPHYRLMLAWRAHEHIDFNFCDCQLQSEIRSEDEGYIKSKCRARINMAGTFIQIIGDDTRYKHKYVRWEAEVALERKCRIIGVNVDAWRFINEVNCPPILRNVGALFVPFSPQIIAHALQDAVRKESDNWFYPDLVYTRLGYRLDGNRAVRVPKHFSILKARPGSDQRFIETAWSRFPAPFS